MAKFSDLPLSERRWRIAAAFIGLGGVALMLAQPILAYLFTPRIPPLTHDFCALRNGNIVYIDKGVGGSDLYLYDRQAKTRRLIARTPYFEEEPSLSADDKQIVCTFVAPHSRSSGLEIVDLERGTYRLLLRDRFAGDTHPIFSPSGLHIAFAHYGSGWEAPLAVDARRYLCEVDLRTGEVSDLVKKHAYSYIENPLYLDENHLVFHSEFDSNYGRASNDVFATYTRGRGARNLPLSEWSNLYFLAYLRANDSFLARVTTSEQQEQIDIISRKDLNAPKSWLRTPVHYEHPPSWQERETNLAYQAAYSPGTGEILTLTENMNGYTINAISLRSGKATTVLTLPK